MKIVVEEADDLRLDIYLADYFEEISRSKLSKLIKKGEVLVNGSISKPSYILSDSDIININLKALRIKKIEAEDLPIEIIFQDEDIAIINKPAGIISHPTNHVRSNTVVNFLINKFENLSYLNGDERPGIVHRLDKDTSGLMIIALTDRAMIRLKEIFKNREITKKYRAIVNHKFNDIYGVIEENISRNLRNRKLMSVRVDGKYAKTIYQVVKQTNDYAYLDINIETGRTHQIRVHMAYINHPVLGDKDYNNIKSNFNINSQLLQAYHLEFNHPITNEKKIFEIPQYPEFEKFYNIIFQEE